MKVKQLKSNNPSKTNFVISETTPEFINSLRRALISEIPVLAISKVNYSLNSSALNNEILAHRLGLIALTNDPNYFIDCTCKGKGCSKCTVKLTLNVKGPGIAYARDLKSTDENVKPVHPDTPIIKLFEGQEVILEAEARIGKGTEHARFNACMAYHRNYPKITIKESCKEAVKVCPKDVFEMTSDKLTIKNLEACDLCQACTESCKDKIKVEGVSDKFILTVESWGQYKIKDLITTTVNELLNRTKEFSEKALE